MELGFRDRWHHQSTGTHKNAALRSGCCTEMLEGLTEAFRDGNRRSQDLYETSLKLDLTFFQAISGQSLIHTETPGDEAGNR
ncbi:hypothetical protein JCM15831A_07550 [Asaia astilbis]